MKCNIDHTQQNIQFEFQLKEEYFKVIMCIYDKKPTFLMKQMFNELGESYWKGIGTLSEIACKNPTLFNFIMDEICMALYNATKTTEK